MNNVGKLLSAIKQSGYLSSKDILGTYFNKENRRFSIMKHGVQFICYHNISIDGKWNLVNRSLYFDKYESALYWVAQEIQNL